MRPSATARLSLIDPAVWRHPAFRTGLRDMARVTPGMMAWAVVTGVAMAKAGLPWEIALLMALVVFSAGAQLATVPLLMAGAPLWVVWLTAACVNLRFVIFSAHMRRHMMVLPLRWRIVAGYMTADVTYVLMQQRHGDDEPASPDRIEPLAYFLGLAALNWSSWNIAAVCGVIFAAAIPATWGLGFAGTLALLGLIGALLRDRRMAVTAAVGGLAAVAAFSLPFKLHIVVAVAAAVASGLLMDEVQRRGRAGPGAGSATP